MSFFEDFFKGLKLETPSQKCWHIKQITIGSFSITLNIKKTTFDQMKSLNKRAFPVLLCNSLFCFISSVTSFCIISLTGLSNHLPFTYSEPSSSELLYLTLLTLVFNATLLANETAASRSSPVLDSPQGSGCLRGKRPACATGMTSVLIQAPLPGSCGGLGATGWGSKGYCKDPFHVGCNVGPRCDARDQVWLVFGQELPQNVRNPSSRRRLVVLWPWKNYCHCQLLQRPLWAFFRKVDKMQQKGRLVCVCVCFSFALVGACLSRVGVLSLAPFMKPPRSVFFFSFVFKLFIWKQKTDNLLRQIFWRHVTANWVPVKNVASESVNSLTFSPLSHPHAHSVVASFSESHQ